MAETLILEPGRTLQILPTRSRVARAAHGAEVALGGLVKDCGQHGFTLIEVVVAALVLSIAAAGTVALCVSAVKTIGVARIQTQAMLLAIDKLDALRAAGAEGQVSGGALDRDVPGFVDFMESDGRPASEGSAPSGRAMYVRRWRVDLSPDDPWGSTILQVLVAPVAAPRSNDPAGVVRVPGDVLLAGIGSTRGR